MTSFVLFSLVKGGKKNLNEVHACTLCLLACTMELYIYGNHQQHYAGDEIVCAVFTCQGENLK